MTALILLATLKKEGLSNTQTLSEFLADKMSSQGIQTEIIKLVDHTILPGTYSDMGPGDEWPSILGKILAADIIVFATPIWWGNQSSEMQRVIERLDEIHDEILEGKESKLYGKVGGIVITGSSDGGEHIIGNIANFFNAIGLVFPPYATLSVLDAVQRKGAKTTREELLEKYEKEYAGATDKMIEQMVKYRND
jgi:multimeric flavodoxin WrbA